MNNATLISIVPFPINEFKPGIYPGVFEIPASRNNEPELLVIGESIYHVEIDENRTITVKCPADDIAKSVVNDYVISNLQYSEDEDAAPGLIWKSGKITKEDLMFKYSSDIRELIKRQERWFIKLVKLADDDWEKTRQHKFISDMQRFAARSLKLDRPWIIIQKTVEDTIKCPACQTNISPTAIVCSSCRCIINLDKYKSLQFAEVK